MAKLTLCTKTPSANVKVAEPKSKKVYATYRATSKKDKVSGEVINKTCPQSCALLAICYANSGMVNVQQANAALRNDNVGDWIKQLPENSLVRHLVSGDLFLDNEVDTDYINETIEGHTARPDVKGYGYTHGWEQINPYELNKADNVNFNASCDTEADILKAISQGWDAVTVTDSKAAKVIIKDNYKQVKCPNQTVGITCEKCQLCAKQGRFDKDGLPIVIAFEAHGVLKGNVIKAIEKAVGDV